ncbi:MAG: hypothetical protein EZS28_033916 [Streblomastix strix]|uniref:Uncharacterized protein n=1 Tax=Streblomastix strix TaxID=222440 RepID=A0A5J4UIB0_9EUKA|nr:MAG: hypothetical protein EZS28_033916 [Streblomastix strix]
MEQAAIQTVERPRKSTISTRSVHNMLIPLIPAYPQQHTPRIPLLFYTTESNQQFISPGLVMRALRLALF